MRKPAVRGWVRAMQTSVFWKGALLLALLCVLVSSGCVQPAVCGNGICEAGETHESCPVESGGDCPPVELCGNGFCDEGAGENFENCPADCKAQHYECCGEYCVLVDGAEPDECSVDGDCAAEPAESCFVELYIEETKSAGSIGFSLLEAEAVYGAYAGLVVPLDSVDEADYALRTYNGEGMLLGEYAAYSSRFVVFDDFSDEGEAFGMEIETDYGVIEAILPHDVGVAAVTVYCNGSETDLGLDFRDLEGSC